MFQFVVSDAGGTIGPTNIIEGLNTQTPTFLGTSAADCMRNHLNDCVEFLADLHTINKVKVCSQILSYSVNFTPRRSGSKQIL